MKELFYVDLAMCGGEEFAVDFNLEDFCDVLQRKLPGVAIVPVTDPLMTADNSEPLLVSEAVFREALGEYIAGAHALPASFARL